MKWKYFLAAAFVVGAALLKAGAPLLSILLGIGLAVLLNLRQRARLAKTKPKSDSQATSVKDGKSMKKIEAIIQPFKLDEVKEALHSGGIEGVTVTDVRGHGRQEGHTEVYRGQEYKVDLLPKVRIDVVVADDRLTAVVDALTNAARSGKIGNGKSLSLPLMNRSAFAMAIAEAAHSRRSR
jgi:nitrogen regulatory protein P-II 1